jgi:hypothetical protein
LPSARECENYAVANYAWPSVVSKVHATYRDVADRK